MDGQVVIALWGGCKPSKTTAVLLPLVIGAADPSRGVQDHQRRQSLREGLPVVDHRVTIGAIATYRDGLTRQQPKLRDEENLASASIRLSAEEFRTLASL
jgi:hypothetical protein